MTSFTLLNLDSQVILYQTEDGHTRIKVRFKGETAWLSLNQMAELFQRDKSVISKHIRNVFSEGELTENSTVAKFATVQTEYSKYQSLQADLVTEVEKDFLAAAKKIEKIQPAIPKKTRGRIITPPRNKQ